MIRERTRPRTLANERCPYCHDTLALGLVLEACAGCGTPHHAACLLDHGWCAVHGCALRVAAASPHPPSFLARFGHDLLLVARTLRGAIERLDPVALDELGRLRDDPDIRRLAEVLAALTVMAVSTLTILLAGLGT